MRSLFLSLLAAGYCCFDLALAQAVPVALNASLVGTWSTKSFKVITGPNFYHPETDTFTEPALTGISYSFSADGYFEEAYYRAIPNPTSPQYPAGIIQWQHGTVTEYSNGSLVLNPIACDGRQLMSQPGVYKTAVLTYYDQPQIMEKYDVFIDPYNDQPRLNLFGFEGTPVNPMWQVYTTPFMLPTTTLTPPGKATAPPSARRAKRRVDEPRSYKRSFELPKKKKRDTAPPSHYLADRLFWIGLGATTIGGVLVWYY